MFTRTLNLVRAVLAAALIATVSLLTVPAQAATTNYGLGVPVVVFPFHLDGQFTATLDPVAEFQIPFAARVIGVSGTCQASGGTSPTLTIDVEDDGTSVLSSAISITADTVAEGTVTNPAVADESNIAIVFTIGGSSPTWDDCTVLITVVRQ